MSASMQVEGLASLEAKLTELGAELGQKVLTAAARRAMWPVLEEAQRLVPKDSGDLRDAIKLSTGKPASGETVAVAGLRIGRSKGGKDGGLPPAARWHFVEFGTAHQSAHPFLRPALDSQAPRVVDELKTELAKGIKRALARKARGK